MLQTFNNVLPFAKMLTFYIRALYDSHITTNSKGTFILSYYFFHKILWKF